MSVKFKRYLSLLIVFMLVLMISGCKKPEYIKPQYKPYFTEHFPTKFDSNKYILMTHLTSDVEDFDKDESIDCYYQIYQPETGIPALDTEIRNFIQSEIKTTKELFRENSGLNINYTIEEYLGSIRKVVLYGYSAPLSEQEVKVHPVNKAFFYTIEDNNIFFITDLFTEEGLNGFYSLFADKLFKEANVDTPVDKMPKGLVESALSLNEQGLPMVFEEYSLSNTQSNEVTITFLWEEIADFLTEDYYKMFKEYLPKRGRQLDPNKPMIALTFDDGPSKFSVPLGELAAKHGGLITYFVVGNRIDEFSDTLVKVSEMGHEIGNHTWAHSNLTKLSIEKQKETIQKTSDKVKELTGKGTTVIRPPYGSYNDQVRQMSKDIKIPLVNWNVDTRDWESRDEDKVYHEAMIHAGDGKIVLFHDLYESTYNACKRIIPELIERGYQLVTVSELIEYKFDEVEYGFIYGYNK